MATKSTTANAEERIRHATTPAQAEALLFTLRKGDRVRFDGDEWKVTDTAENDRGTPFVTFTAKTGYHPGSTTLKPGSGVTGAVTKHGRGMPSGYPGIELLERAD